MWSTSRLQLLEKDTVFASVAMEMGVYVIHEVFQSVM